MNPLLSALITALVVTILIEYAILVLLIRENVELLLLYIILINGCTNPLLNYFSIIGKYDTFILEAGVVIVEAILLSLLTRREFRYSLLCSLCINASSFLIGEILFSARVT